MHYMYPEGSDPFWDTDIQDEPSGWISIVQRPESLDFESVEEFGKYVNWLQTVHGKIHSDRVRRDQA